MSTILVDAAADLVGQALPNGWRVTAKVDRRPSDTGGNFSVNYWVENDDGRRGFCKVLNTKWMLDAFSRGEDPVTVIARAATTYEFERDVALECVGLSRVITVIDHGSVMIPGYIIGTVSYIIFEVAERDIRRLLDASNALDIPLRIRALHHLATGLKQLHARGVAHQDVKPSNTLVFAPDGAGERITKVGDLGRATVQGRPMDHDKFDIAGAIAYAPPEGLYHSPADGGMNRRYACDLYQLGSMVCYVFTTEAFNTLLLDQLHPAHNWHNWAGSYSEVLPFVRDAFGRALDAMGADVPESIRPDVIRLVEQLCEPDPMLRGHHKTRQGRGSQYMLERIVTDLDLLYRRSRLELSKRERLAR